MKWLDSLQKGCRSMIDDGSGMISSTRVIMLTTVGEILGRNILMNIPVLIHNFTGSVQYTPVGFDNNDVQLLMYVFAAKVLTSGAEWLQQKIGKVG